MYYTYVLRSQKTDRLYTGSTNDLKRRVAEHNSGKSRATASSRPFELIHYERYDSRSEAYKREMYLKTGKGRDELRSILGSSYNG